MNKTKIEWCDSTWNPVTGCLHGCEYCYARTIARRFGGSIETAPDGNLHELDEPFYADKPMQKDGESRFCAYPYRFDPTFHRYRLNEPASKAKPQNIFVCSMADLFGDWVPDEWIQEVFKACEAAPQHNYLFLTKNPGRYCDLANAGKLPKEKNFWYGTTLTTNKSLRFPGDRGGYNTFLSIEPILEYFDSGIGSFGFDKWIIIGAETGNRKGKVIPERRWIENIVETAGITHAAVFMKNSLVSIMGEENMLREFPRGLRK